MQKESFKQRGMRRSRLRPEIRRCAGAGCCPEGARIQQHFFYGASGWKIPWRIPGQCSRGPEEEEGCACPGTAGAASTPARSRWRIDKPGRWAILNTTNKAKQQRYAKTWDSLSGGTHALCHPKWRHASSNQRRCCCPARDYREYSQLVQCLTDGWRAVAE
jgi:hypothetical protein